MKPSITIYLCKSWTNYGYGEEIIERAFDSEEAALNYQAQRRADNRKAAYLAGNDMSFYDEFLDGDVIIIESREVR